MQKVKQAFGPVAAVFAALFAIVALGFGTDPTPESIVTSGATGLVTSILNVANSTWPIWVPVIAVMIGIRLFRKIAKA